MSFNARVLCLALILTAQSAPVLSADDLSAPGEYAPPQAAAQRAAPNAWIDLIRAAPPKPLKRFGRTDEATSAPLRDLKARNRTGQIPFQNGFRHPIDIPARVSIDPESTSPVHVDTPPISEQRGVLVQSSSGDLTWAASVAIDDAYRLRLQLTRARLSQDVQMWVYGESGELTGPFGKELVAPDGTLWTPSVDGPVITLVVSVPSTAPPAMFSISAVAELFQLDSQGQPLLGRLAENDASCILDTQCMTTSDFGAIEETEKAVALLTYMRDGGSYLCSGGLVNDTDTSTYIPYLFTANHCIDSAGSAASLEAFWDYKRDACLGATPSLSSLPRSYGATLLATGTAGDYTLLRLNSMPGGRYLMGWNASSNAVAHGTVLHRISHPTGLPQSYSKTRVDTTTRQCSGLSRPEFIYETPVLGGTMGGSSGSLVQLDNGQIVGQLFGACGPNVSVSCDYANQTVDGSLASYWPSVANYLNPPRELPLPPAQVDASDGLYTDRIAIGWSAVTGATSYNVYYSSSYGSEQVLLGNYTGTAINATGTGPGDVWYFWVYSVNATGESASGTFDTGYRAASAEELAAIDLIESFYWNILGRAPEAGAVDSWLYGYFDYALSFDIDVRFVPREMARIFFLSTEYAERNRSNEEFLRDCYRTFLNRDPSAQELSDWLSGTWNRSQVMTLFAESAEFGSLIQSLFPGLTGNPTRNLVTTMYIGLLDRLVDSGGLEYFSGLIDAAYASGGIEGVRNEARSLGRAVFRSEEYLSTNPTNETHVIRLYRAYLGRFPSDSEIGYWGGELQSNRQTTDTLIDIFAGSQEFTDRLNRFF